MKQVLIKLGKTNIQEVPAPTITNPNQILIKNLYSVISNETELKNLIQNSKRRPDAVSFMIDNLKTKGLRNTINKVIDRLDLTLGQQVGYSTSGIVTQTGSNVKNIKKGDLVSCAGKKFASHAEIICVPKELVVKVPKNVSMIDASTTAIGAICIQAIKKCDLKKGKWVLVKGLSLCGLITSQILKAKGYKVIGVDSSKKKRNFAKKLGLNYVFDSQEKRLVKFCNNLTNNQGVYASIITTTANINDSLKLSIEITRKNGKVELLKSVKKIYMKEYLRLLAKDEINLTNLKSKIYKMNSVSKAFKELKKNQNTSLIFIEYEKENTDMKSLMTLENKKVKGKINVAVIGAGWMSKEEHLHNINKNKNLDLYMLVDRNPANAQKTAKYFKAKKVSTNFMDAINDQEVDMVLISTKNDSHAKMIIEASKAKKQIFVEKPITINRKELKQVKEVIRKNKTPIIVGFNRRFSQYTQKIIKNTINRKNPLLVNYRVNAGYRPPSDWTQNILIGGGRIIGEACHMIDFFNYITQSKPKSINVSSITPRLSDCSPIDNSITTIEYEDGSVCNLIYTALGNSKLPKEYIEIFCDQNVFIINDFKKMTILKERKKEVLKKGLDKGINQILTSWSNYLKNNKREPPIPFEESILATEITFKIMDKLNNKLN